MIALAIMLLFGIAILFYIFSIVKYYPIIRKVRGPFAVPILGNIWQYLTQDVSKFETLQNFIDSYGLHSRIWAGTKMIYTTIDPQELEIILNHPNSSNKASFYSIGTGVAGNGLLLYSGQKWADARKLVAHGFRTMQVDNYTATIYRKNVKLIEKLTKQCATGPRDILYEMFEFTFDSFCTNFLQYDRHDLGEFNYGRKLLALVGLAYQRLLQPWLWPDFTYALTGNGRKSAKLIDEMDEFIRGIIDEKRCDLNDDDDDCHGDEKKKTNHLIDVFLDPTNRLSDAFVFNNIKSLMMAGSTTSAVTLSFSCVLLGGYSDVQKRLHDEVMTTVGRNGPIDCSNIGNMKYLHAFISEVLRLFPHPTIIGRYTTGTVPLEHYTIPASTEIVISVINLHRHPKFWPDPLKFDPTRFLPDNCTGRHPYSYIPFSIGPKNCIGKRYALLVMKIALANLVRNFEFKSNYTSIEQIDIIANLITTMKGGFVCSLKNRN